MKLWKLVIGVAMGIVLGLWAIAFCFAVFIGIAWDRSEQAAAEQQQQAEQQHAEAQKHWEKMVDDGNHPGFLPQNRMQ